MNMKIGGGEDPSQDGGSQNLLILRDTLLFITRNENAILHSRTVLMIFDSSYG